MTLTIIYMLLPLFCYAVAKSETDTIRFNPHKAWYQTDYWLSNKNTDNRGWWLKYPLSFMWDGWHLLESIKIICLYFIVGIALQLSAEYVALVVLMGYIVNGIIFEYFYQN